MQQRNSNQPAAPSITIGDVYYVLFKHKWKIIVSSLLGIAAAAGIYFLTPPPYQSEALLLIRFVEDARATAAPSAPGDDRQVKQVDSRGEGIMSSEASILTSIDVSAAVVDALGAEKILGKGAASTNREFAAAMLKKNLTVDVPKKGNVLRVAYENKDRDICQPVLRRVIDAYFKKHVEIHKNLGVLDDFFTQQTDSLRTSLSATEEELRKLKNKAGVVSLEDARKRYSDQFSRLQNELLAAEVELGERQASLTTLQKLALVSGAAEGAAATNAPSAEAPKVKPPAAVVSEYKRLLSRLETVRKREAQLLDQFTEDNSTVKDIQSTIAGLEKRQAEMEEAHPQLAEVEAAVVRTPERREVMVRDTRGADIATETARVEALKSKVRTLAAQFDKVKADAGSVDEVETSLIRLQRQKELQETQYKYYSTSLDQARFDSQLGAGKLSNISEIQGPSLPFRDPLPLQKKLAIALAAGIFGGLALAFLLEFVIDQSVRKPGEVESKFNLPVFLSIPNLNGRVARNGRAPKERKLLKAGGGSDGAAAPANGVVTRAPASAEIAPWDDHHDLHPYSEALRDRLVTFFELKNMTHRPKLIALTSCSPKAGVTTLAAGLAASLSETGEGNVLLVDMNMEQGAAHPFYKGKPACGLDDVLEHEKRPAAMVQDNLYMVRGAAGDDRLPKILPKRFAHLLPKLQASDYDYIIFDMPAISQTSVTPRLAGFMDMVFLVVESESTNREWLKQASSLLHQSKANVGTVFNKRRDYVPKWLHQEF